MPADCMPVMRVRQTLNPWTLHAGVQEMLAVAEQMDLSQNVFQDGTWGTLRYTPRLHMTYHLVDCRP